MFPVKLLPFFVIGCGTLPATEDTVEFEPTNDPTTDPTTDSAKDPRVEQIDDRRFEQVTDPTDDPTDDPVEPVDFSSLDSMEVRVAIYGELGTLQGLQIIEVSDVILDVPDEAICAYGWTPCLGFEDTVDDALREVGPRLASLVVHAEQLVEEDAAPQATTCRDDVIDANLDALADLEIVLVGDLLVAEPELNCPYGLPCEEDILAASEITCERADTLDRIVFATQKI